MGRLVVPGDFLCPVIVLCVTENTRSAVIFPLLNQTLNAFVAAACNVWYLGSVEMESLTGTQAVQKAASMTLSLNPPPTSTVVHFKVSSQGITLTDNQRKCVQHSLLTPFTQRNIQLSSSSFFFVSFSFFRLFFRRHYNVNTVIFCALDPEERM